jgi:anti-sigma B factor antagonist
MPIKCEEYDQTCVVAIEGDLSGEAAAQLRNEIDSRIDRQQIASFVLDMEKCPFVDSEGLETLLWAKRRCDDLFGQLKLAGLDENFRKILELTRMEHRFECHEALEEAMRMIR